MVVALLLIAFPAVAVLHWKKEASDIFPTASSLRLSAGALWVYGKHRILEESSVNPITLFLLVLPVDRSCPRADSATFLRYTDLVGGGVTTGGDVRRSDGRRTDFSPGPNGLWIVSLGYLISGWWGALSATVAVLLPPLLVLVIERLYSRVSDHPAVEGLMRGLSLAVVGIFLVVMGRMVATFQHDNLALAATVVALGLGLSKRVPVLWVILGAGVLVAF